MKFLKTSLITLASVLVLSAPAFAGEAEDKGLAIAKESKVRDLGWGDTQARMQMLLRNQHGETSTRQMRIKSMEQENDGDKSLTIFDSPRDVKGTAFLSFSHPTANDEQWLYLPALKRVKRISSRNKSGSFMGSEFSFEDLTSFEIEKYTYKYIKDDTFNGVDCYVVEQYPVDKYSGYTKRVVWIDKAEYRSQKVEFYDRKKSLLKTLTFSDYKKYLDKYWRATKLSMVNHQSGKSTDLTWSDYQFRAGLDEKDFNKNALKRAR
ncbi:outer membrane lipoprotein-sorting protein [Aliikangiella marina]|uniref:Outer membrane lipoprotein-sorting protein n=1 Tax=Aliikangiella marina TaxID=1712262 RepID=A0A545T6T6_9GAMM|nr:outer membrane lipoprotein-sorting protein [Aliikangiella marina]TQV72940.1 outer membrane lipoprotein-sorting protein [Aliikangiella marina]